MNNKLKFALVLLLIYLSGCTVKGDYSCGVPQNGVSCQPMSQTHEQLYDGTLKSLYTDPFPGEDKSKDYGRDFADDDSLDDELPTVSTTASSTVVARLPSIATVEGFQAILSPPREMRIWFDRFTDPEGDLHDESFVFIRLDNGHWMIDNKPVLY